MSKKRRDIPHFNTPIVETHCHLDYLDNQDLNEVITKAQAVGVERLVTIAVSTDNLDKVLTLAQSTDCIWGTQGIHPHEADSFNRDVATTIATRLAEPKIVAVGEIGLDYYYDHADRGVQRQVFEQQLQLAIDHDMPVVIHTREADEDTRDMLRSCSGQLRKTGVIHSFTSSIALAEFCLDEGFMLGFNGIATFNRADNVREVIAKTPLHRIVLETDSPYLTPVPYRGRPNAPFYLPFIAEKVAEIKACDIQTLLQQCYQNSLELYRWNT